ncbi:MAG: ABC transporter substrate-binding protein [Chloroflexota bacterium]|nr:ABC transporter substrate-binding protein [Chloroflexota bacterium]
MQDLGTAPNTRLSRRRFLGRVALVLGGLSTGLLAACGAQPAAPAPSKPAEQKPAEAKPATAPTQASKPAEAKPVAAATTAPATTRSPRKGEVVAAMSEQVLTLDPANHYSIASTSILRHIFDPLVDVTSDHKLVPALAESWETVDDLTWKFKLRQGVNFHDGTPFNADSVIYTLTRVRDDSKLIKSFVYQDIASVEKDGDAGVIVKTKAPFGSLPGHLTMLGMLPPSAKGNEEAFFNQPIGTGPFKFVAWTRGERVELEANESYWVSGRPKVAKATIRTIPEISTRSAGLRSGEIDIIDRIPADLVTTLEGSQGVKVLQEPAVETQQWVFQHEKAPVNDPRVRRAISMGIDRATIIKEFHLGFAQDATCPTPPGLIGYTDLGVKAYKPDEAKALLRDAGVPNPTIDFVLMKGVYPKQTEIAQAVEAMLGEIGVRVNIREMEVAAARDARTAGDYHLFYSGWAHMPHDPDWYYGQWFTRAGAEKLSRYNNPTVEQLIMEARRPDPAVRQAKYEELQKIIWDEEEATIWPYYSIAVYGVRDRVGGFEARSDYYVPVYDVEVG